MRPSIVVVLDDVAGDRPDAALKRRRVVSAGAAAPRRLQVVDAHELLPHRGHASSSINIVYFVTV